MRLFIATLSTETNTFATMPTDMAAFKAYYLRHGTATQDAPNLMTEALHLWRGRAEELGWHVTESLAAIAEPAGLTKASVYEALAGEILNDLKAAGGADIVLLQLHGAMVSEGVEDCEGDLTARVRAICPDAVIGMGLDLHCHITDQMLEAADIIIGFKEYPHDDATPRAAELLDLAHRTALGQIQPVMATYNCRMIHLYLTKTPVMRAFIDQMEETQAQDGVLSLTLGHGFPWGDVPDMGAKMLVVTDNDSDLAKELAQRFGQQFFDLRHQVTGEFLDLNAALDQAITATAQPLVLADMGDNSGGGAPGDSTFILQTLLERDLGNLATGIYWDPAVVKQCQEAGIGASIDLILGGKASEMSGTPLSLNAKVMAIKSGLGQHLGPGLEPLGIMVWLRHGDSFDILVNDLRTQVYHPEAFTQMGIDLSQKHIITVKSLFHFYAPFAEIAAEVIQVATPGGTCPEFTSIPFKNRDLNYWPRVEDPFAAAQSCE